MLSLNLYRRRQVKTSVLDIPLEKYDKVTGLPRTIKIGEDDVAPFVSLQETRDHLTFLSALSDLRSSLPVDLPNLFSATCLDSAKSYANWVQYVLPARQTDGTLSKEELPSLHVLMAWHAHLLNPTIYDNDIQGAYRALTGLEFPLTAIAEAIRQDTLPPFRPLTPEQESDLQKTVWSPEETGMAIERQAKFIANMKRIGWLREEYWQKGLMELQFSIVLYHAWLDLMQSTQSRYFLVPRLDIDLAWHTHQLNHARYKADTNKILGKLLNHNVAAGDEKIGDGLEVTKKLWKERFGWEYQ
ncbi:uncharacterized protein I303_107165 [Kwoniella dejecticola CBS 10117]|uniref:Uncharacterized protein n=1 Tax=Kwoniella dejecticola CBS 10117 TaxID=1296121 RepID=A0A1A5ZYX5_9TREE|nr:uncharacterized protein I303_06566 [Kwoniella dejecticola CBS 10117]OBR83007.1 hypothetical protein I303_06566 [Kwoniella dejecticola CBS 10117]